MHVSYMILMRLCVMLLGWMVGISSMNDIKKDMLILLLLKQTVGCIISKFRRESIMNGRRLNQESTNMTEVAFISVRITYQHARQFRRRDAKTPYAKPKLETIGLRTWTQSGQEQKRQIHQSNHQHRHQHQQPWGYQQP